MSMNSRKWICLVLGAVSIIAVAACGRNKSGSSDSEPIKIGAIYPFSGAGSATGEDLKAGMDLALEVINGVYDLPITLAKSRGLPNRGNARIQIIYRDDQSDPKVAAKLVEELVTRERVKAIIGCYSSTITAAASEQAEMMKVPFLNAASTSPTLTQRGFKWFFRTTPHDEMFAQNFFTLLSEFPKRSGIEFPKRLVLVFENRLWGTSVAQAERKLAQKLGYEIIEEVPYDARATGFEEELKRIKASFPAIIMQASYELDAIAFMKGYKTNDIEPLALLAMNAGFISPQFLKTLGTDGNFVMSREVWALDLGSRKPLVTSVNELFRKKQGRNMTGNSARAFTAMMVLADAINRASSSDFASIREALLTTDIKPDQLIMPWDGVKFDRNSGQNILGKGIIVQVQDAQYWTVWPWDLASKPIVWPMRSWRAR
jgi:branched-chain amino acid transport system substrate-binding protein